MQPRGDSVGSRWLRPSCRGRLRRQAAPRNDEKQGGNAMATARVVLSSGFSRRYTGGAREFDVEAKTMRDVMKEIDRRYPGPRRTSRRGDHRRDRRRDPRPAGLFPEAARRLRDLLHPEARRRLTHEIGPRTIPDRRRAGGPRSFYKRRNRNGLVSAGLGDRDARLRAIARIRSTRRSRSARA